ncbi:integrin alpha-M-like [Pseudophryne corroboree]|uniref:integrin alpha-M-like n=1 Tax=Pseudophryne corroboree TaxID=495146 RepID=UPI00308161CE
MAAVLLCMGLSSVGAFFVDTEKPIIFRNSARSFGYQVVQLDKRVIVSAPLQQVAINRTGQLYRCDPGANDCTPITITGSEDDNNMSLGLALTTDDSASNILACGPTLQRTCGQNIYVNGRCYQLDRNLRTQDTIPASLPECSVFSLDIVFLIDGSGSVRSQDFTRMLTFVSTVMSSFSQKDVQFALMQYSSEFRTHFDFKRFSAERDPTRLTRNIIQMFQATRTATAIHMVIETLFVSQAGSRDRAQKLLIVITDGETAGDNMRLTDSVAEAERRGVLRFAIGVGNAFIKRAALQELKTIASSDDRVLRVDDFSALSNIQNTLQDKIFAIEGTQSKSESSFEFEMSQEGFSGTLAPDGAILGAVGAYDWSGGANNYRSGRQDGTFMNATWDQIDMRDSYLGYAMQQVTSGLVALGAPRYQHTGKVLIFRMDPSTSQWHQKATVQGEQIGSYFGSVLSVARVNSTKFLLVVGAPTYYSPNAPGGRVYLCPIPDQVMDPSKTLITFPCPRTLQGDSTQSESNFGSAISVLPDLTGDRLPDLAIGAPFEDNNRGAMYIFPGQVGGFRSSYIQRIAGSRLTGGMMFFGKSVTGNLDMTGDGLPDITIGSEGNVLILSSRPVLAVSVSMSTNPREILLSTYDCSVSNRKDPAITITVCFSRELRSSNANAGTSAQVQYTLLLDAGRTVSRAVFSDTPQSVPRTVTTTVQLTEAPRCTEHKIRLPECVDDSLSPLRVALNYTLMGNPVLSEDSHVNQSREITFEKNCGADGVCKDDLSVNLTFTGLSQLVVGTSLDVNLTVSVKNQGEDSYNTRVLIPFPLGLSYRRVTLVESNKRGTISCSTLESQRVLICGVNNPLLRPDSMVVFMVSFHVASNAELGDRLAMTANVTSDNQGAVTALMMSSSQIRVLYAIYVTISSLEESSKYHNYSSSDTSVQHVYKVNNLGDRRLPLSVIFLVPVRLGESLIWEETNVTSSQPQLTKCTVMSETAGAANYQVLLKTNPILNCSVGSCLRTVCNISDLGTQTSVTFTIRGSVTKAWTTQTEQQKISLQSSAEIAYDSSTYHQNHRFIRAQAQTVLEIYVAYNYAPIIIGSSVGGLVLLALIAAGLYKLGFFKRQYKEMLENPGDDGAGNEAAQEPQSNGAPE